MNRKKSKYITSYIINKIDKTKSVVKIRSTVKDEEILLKQKANSTKKNRSANTNVIKVNQKKRLDSLIVKRKSQKEIREKPKLKVLVEKIILSDSAVQSEDEGKKLKEESKSSLEKNIDLERENKTKSNKINEKSNKETDDSLTVGGKNFKKALKNMVKKLTEKSTSGKKMRAKIEIKSKSLPHLKKIN